MRRSEARAHARLATASAPTRDGPDRSVLDTLRSEWPLMLRSTSVGVPALPAKWASQDSVPAHVHLASAGAGPLGGDQLALQVRVGAGSSLILGEVSPTLLLPGPDGAESRTRIDIEVAAGAALLWLPQLVIAAAECRHRTEVHISLAPDARLLLREEVLFGRSGEEPGSYAQRLRITRDERPLYDQELTAGPHAPGWSGPTTTAGHRSAGNLVLIDPWMTDPSATAQQSATDAVAVFPMTGAGTVTSALAADTAALRTRLDTALEDALGATP